MSTGISLIRLTDENYSDILRILSHKIQQEGISYNKTQISNQLIRTGIENYLNRNPSVALFPQADDSEQ